MWLERDDLEWFDCNSILVESVDPKEKFIKALEKLKEIAEVWHIPIEGFELLSSQTLSKSSEIRIRVAVLKENLDHAKK